MLRRYTASRRSPAEERRPAPWAKGVPARAETPAIATPPSPSCAFLPAPRWARGATGLRTPRASFALFSVRPAKASPRSLSDTIWACESPFPPRPASAGTPPEPRPRRPPACPAFGTQAKTTTVEVPGIALPVPPSGRRHCRLLHHFGGLQGARYRCVGEHPFRADPVTGNRHAVNSQAIHLGTSLGSRHAFRHRQFWQKTGLPRVLPPLRHDQRGILLQFPAIRICIAELVAQILCHVHHRSAVRGYSCIGRVGRPVRRPIDGEGHQCMRHPIKAEI